MRRLALALTLQWATLQGATALLLGCSSKDIVRNDVPWDGGEAFPSSLPAYDIAAGDLAVVSNSYGDTLSLLDLAKNTVVATVPVDLDPLATDGPHHVAIDAKGEFLFTPLAYPTPTIDLGPHASHGASRSPGVLLKLRVRDLARVGALTIENNPGDVLLTPDGKKAIVSHFELSRALEGMKAKKPLAELRAPLVIVDVATMTKVAAPAPCIASHGMTVSADGKKLYLACYGEDAIGVVDLANPTAAAELWPLAGTTSLPPDITVGPYFVVLTASGKELVVGETEGKSFRVVSIETKTTIARVPLGGAVFGPAESADGARFLVPVQGPDKLVAIDAATWTVSATRALTKEECERPHQIARRGERFFLVCEGDHVKASKILELDGLTLATLRSFDVGVYPDVIAFPGYRP